LKKRARQAIESARDPEHDGTHSSSEYRSRHSSGGAKAVREFTPQDFLAMLRRHWTICVYTAVAGLVIGIALALVMPKRYQSKTIVLVEQPSVSPTYVPAAISEDWNSRLASMQQQILSTTRLSDVIQKLNLYPNENGKVPMDVLVARLQTAIVVDPMEPIQGDPDRGLPGFDVTVTFSDPGHAQQICQEVTSLFMEQNSRLREEHAENTTEFLSQQLEEAKAKLDDQDAKLADFKSKHLGDLPDEEQTNLSLLMGYNTQLESVTQNVGRLQQEKAFDESLLSQQLAAWKQSQENHGQDSNTLEQERQAAEAKLTALQAQYTDEYPDVIAAKQDLDAINQKIAAAQQAGPTESSAPAKPTSMEPPQIQQLRAQVQQASIAVEEALKQEQSLQGQIGAVQSRVKASPEVEEDFKDITRDYQTALDFYNDLLKKHDEAAEATDLEHEQEGEQFGVLDPPNYPSRASFPNPVLFSAGGFGGGLALGLVVIAIFMIQDSTLHSDRDVETMLHVPVIAMIPLYDRDGQKGGRLLKRAKSGSIVTHEA
jgi:polysaccharide chain length determinant protein (PEP-CTERM system associated)